MRKRLKCGMHLSRFKLCLGFLLFSINKIAGQIGKGVNEKIKQIYDNYADRCGQSRADGSEEE